jgi:short-subunit dehydrogenase
MTATVLITGGSQGIGKATAERFAQAGYNLVLAARQTDRLEAVAADLRSRFSTSVLAVPTDVRDAEQVNHLVHRAIEQFAGVDVLINNAGIYISGPVEQFSLDDWHTALDTNLWGYIHTIHALLPHLLERRKGTIVNLCSIGGKVPLAYLAPYTTSKFAIAGLTQSLQAELGPKGIQVCGIYPNLIKTSFLERAIFRGQDLADQRDRRQQVEQLFDVPMIEKPEDVAKAVWDAVQHEKSEVLVGTAKLAAGAQSIFSQLTQWLVRKTFQHRDAA